MLEEASGGSNGVGHTGFWMVGGHVGWIACERGWYAPHTKLSCWGLVFPGECKTRPAEGRGEPNGGSYNGFGCDWCTCLSDHA